ncbi:transmembrane aminoacid transporter protein [Ordospora pajunii]|jgi:amino acid permease|uniref:transmembrane aminoacid transporter protein n=1 Tax=Ordospora pajunii TaxID=3039483 RepID=UPI00295269C4|nr:transmembrane aminoacid transporter protein [Ordospora pajunii]KAH9412000.1 transmembrane aminoacid transporter protein [Ordospora pajunii]
MATTLASGYITLLKTTLGSGILSFPYLFKTYGILTGIILTMASGIFSVLGLVLYTICSQSLGRQATLSKLATENMPYVTVLVDFCVFLKCFGVALSYLVITVHLLPSLMLSAFGSSVLSDPSISLLIFILCVGPFSYFSKLDKLKYTSFCGVIAILIVIMATAYRYRYSSFIIHKKIDYFVPVSYTWLDSLGKFVFAFTCHQNIFTVQSEMDDNSPSTMKKLIYMVASTAALLYISFGILNYLLYREAIKDNILQNYPDDLLAFVVRCLYVLAMGVSYPLQVNPCRSHLMNIVSLNSKVDQNDSFMEFIATTAIILSTYLLAISGMGLGTIYSIIGATASTFICLIFPTMLYFRMDIDRSKWLTFLSYAGFVFGMLVFLTSMLSIFFSSSPLPL